MDPFAVPEQSHTPLQMADPMLGENFAPAAGIDYMQQPPQQSSFDFVPAPVTNDSYPPPPQNTLVVDETREQHEDNALSQFMIQWEQSLLQKAAAETQVAKEAKAKAEREMNQFLQERETVKEAKQVSNRMEEQTRMEKMVADLENENPWERVMSLIDKNTSKKDGPPVERMKQLFIQLKAEPLHVTQSI